MLILTFLNNLVSNEHVSVVTRDTRLKVEFAMQIGQWLYVEIDGTESINNRCQNNAALIKI